MVNTHASIPYKGWFKARARQDQALCGEMKVIRRMGWDGMVGKLSVKATVCTSILNLLRLDWVLRFSVFSPGNRVLQEELTDPSVCSSSSSSGSWMK